MTGTAWDDEAVKRAALDVADGIARLQSLQQTHGSDAYLIGQARERVGELHIAYLRVTGEVPPNARMSENRGPDAA